MGDFGVILLCIVIIGGGYLLSTVQEKQRKVEADNAQREFEEIIESGKEQWNFTESKSKTIYYGKRKYYIAVDTIIKQWAIAYNDNGYAQMVRFPCNMLSTYILHDYETLVEDGMGKSGKAIIGGALAGTTGAIAGAASKQKYKVAKDISVWISTTSKKNPEFKIVLAKSVELGSEEYRKARRSAEEICDILEVIGKNK